MLERRVRLSAHASHFCALTQVSISLLVSHFIHLFIAHDAASEHAVICLFTTVQDLGFVSLVHARRWVISPTNIHIRLSSLSRSHVVEHYLPLRVSTPFLVESCLINSPHLAGTSH